jgi:hypothetical protein
MDNVHYYFYFLTKLPNVTGKFCSVKPKCILNREVSYKSCKLFIIYLHMKVHIPSCSGSLGEVINLTGHHILHSRHAVVYEAAEPLLTCAVQF